MQAKIIKGKDFGGVVKYVLSSEVKDGINGGTRVRQGDPELIDSTMVGNSIRGITEEFNTVADMRPNHKEKVWHCVLSLPSNERDVSNEEWTSIAKDFLKEMNLDNNDYILVRHNDTDNPHVHIVLNTIDHDYKISNTYHDYIKANKACEKLEHKYGLELSHHGTEKTKHLERKTIGNQHIDQRKLAQQNKKLPELFRSTDTDRDYIKKSISSAIKTARKDFPTFLQSVASKGIEIKTNVGNEKVNGLSFSVGDSKFGGASLGKDFKWSELSKSTGYDHKKHNHLVMEQREGKKLGVTIKPNVPTISDSVKKVEDVKKELGMTKQENSIPFKMYQSPVLEPKWHKIELDAGHEEHAKKIRDAERHLKAKEKEDAAALDYKRHGDILAWDYQDMHNKTCSRILDKHSYKDMPDEFRKDYSVMYYLVVSEGAKDQHREDFVNYLVEAKEEDKEKSLTYIANTFGYDKLRECIDRVVPWSGTVIDDHKEYCETMLNVENKKEREKELSNSEQNVYDGIDDEYKDMFIDAIKKQEEIDKENEHVAEAPTVKRERMPSAKATATEIYNMQNGRNKLTDSERRLLGDMVELTGGDEDFARIVRQQIEQQRAMEEANARQYTQSQDGPSLGM